jgi:phosphoglycolate phosphatase
VIPPFPAYIFDVDGTLLDSAADICAAARESLALHGVNHLEDAFLRRYIGLHLYDLYREVAPGCSQEWMDAALADYRRIYPARRHRLTRVYPGVAETLARLPGRKTTATTKFTSTTRAVLEQFGLLPFFDHVQGTDGFPAKPAPNVIFAALNGLNARPEDCLFIGDSPADMEAGRRAGVRLCAVRYGYGDLDEMARFQPDFWIDTPQDLLSA